MYGSHLLNSTIKRTALRVPAIRRLHDHRDRLVGELADAHKTIAELRDEHRARIDRLTALAAERAAKLQETAALAAERAAKIEEMAAQLARSALDRPLAFMHVPKTSGLALITAIREVLPSTASLGFFDLSLFGTFREFERLHPATRALIHADGLPAADGADFVAGHFAYSTLSRDRSGARLMTVLREPRSRLLSLWMFWRATSDETLKLWGGPSRRARLSRQPVGDFLRCSEIACQIDNVAVRMLLWPHPLIPDDGFIDEASDQHLAGEAAARLKSFAFADLVENPRLEENVCTFLSRPFVYRRANETQMPPPELRVSLQNELTGEALRLLEHRSRLDRQLWLALAAERMPGVEPEKLSEEIFAGAVARYNELMAA